MNFNPHPSLHSRLFWIVAGSSVVIGGITLLLMFFIAFQNNIQENKSQINRLMQAVEYSAAIAAFTGNAEVANDVIKGLMLDETVCGAQLFNNDQLHAASVKYADTSTCPEAILHTLYSPFDGAEVVGYLETRIDISAVKARSYRESGKLALALIVLLLIPNYVIWLAVSRLVVRPIETLTQQLEEIEPGSTARLAPATTYETKEISQLTHKSNSLLENIESVLVYERAQRNEIEMLKVLYENMAHHDSLTGLPNRALLNDRLVQMLLQAKRSNELCALIYLDLDKFKPVNDTLGHDVGDALLKAVAERLLRMMRKSDTVARVGGDEFVVILHSLHNAQEANDIAHKVLHALAQPFSIGKHTLNIGSSLGVALYPQHGEDAETLSKNADIAMYAAKGAGRNNVQLFKL
jgi:diguanylate cyclase (GGDEF)-like protein